METTYPIYPREKDFKSLYDEYERIFGDRPPNGSQPEDYNAARNALEFASFQDPAIRRTEPVKVWPSQKA